MSYKSPKTVLTKRIVLLDELLGCGKVHILGSTLGNYFSAWAVSGSSQEVTLRGFSSNNHKLGQTGLHEILLAGVDTIVIGFLRDGILPALLS